MRKQKLGRTGLEVSVVGFGGIPIQRIDSEKAVSLIAALAENGINFIDTARAYTTSEEWIGEAISRNHLQGKFILATKAPAVTREEMKKAMETSFRNLQTDYIDLYQIHNLSMDKLKNAVAPGGSLEVLQEAKAEGRIGHIGLTTHSAEVFEYALTLEWVETIMFPYNIIETQGTDLIRKCAESGKGFICMKPLAGGAIEDGRLAMRYILNNPDVSVVIPGMASVEEVRENTAAAEELSELTREEEDAVTEIRRKLGTVFCRRCNYCAPCTVGIAIPSVFLFQGYLERYDLEKWARERYATLPAKASDCIACGICETRCPYQLPIREMMAKAAEEFDA